MADRRGEGSLVPLGVEPPPPPPPSPPTRLQGAAMMGLAGSALIGLFATIAFVTVSWPADAARVVVGVIVLSGAAFLASASIAVFSSARTTAMYVQDGRDAEAGLTETDEQERDRE